MPLILLAILALPFLEIAVYIKVGEWIGVWPTIGLTLLSSIAGLQLMRYQGLVTLAHAREAIRRNEPPVGELLDGLVILLAGFLLIIPGFITDAIGLALFVPALRRRIRGLLWRGLGAREQQRQRRATVIETSYEVVDEGRGEGEGHGEGEGRGETKPKPRLDRDRER